MPKISVVIPLYNKGFIISETLESVLVQTFTDFEIVIVNDGSTDSSFEIVSQYTDNRIRLYNQENKGVSKTRNAGIEYSKSDLIAFLDADDYWHPNHLEELYQLYIDFPNCGLYASRYFMKISEENTIKTTYIQAVYDNFRGILPDYFLASMQYRVGLTSAVAIPKEMIQGNFLFNPELNGQEDLELFTKIAIQKPVAITNKYTVEYNFAIENQLSKIQFIQKKIIKFDQFSADENKNKSLKKFLDLYRLEYALQFRIIGDIKESKFYLKDITTKIPFKTRVLLVTPSYILRLLIKIKHALKKRGIDFTVYH
jgi:glycosyltransferase involved in cell wall biosynthesis